jgi:hypothetical protein
MSVPLAPERVGIDGQLRTPLQHLFDEGDGVGADQPLEPPPLEVHRDLEVAALVAGAIRIGAPAVVLEQRGNLVVAAVLRDGDQRLVVRTGPVIRIHRAAFGQVSDDREPSLADRPCAAASWCCSRRGRSTAMSPAGL